MKEAKQICMQKHVKVDGKVRTDVNYPAGFMDTVSLEKSGDQFRLLYDAKGRFTLHRISDDELKYKLCRVVKQEVTKNKVPYVATHDGRTFRYADPLVKVHDTVKVDIESQKILEFVKFESGNICMITKGRNAGRVGIIGHIERHPGSFDIVSVKDAAGNTFATRLQNVFTIGQGNKPWITLPKGKGIKLNILEERTLRANANKK